MINALNIVSVSDIHLGNTRVETSSICDRLRTYLFPKLKECNLLVLGGDITDTTLGLGDNSSIYLIDFFLELFTLTNKLNIPIVMLRGTISHDRNHLKTLRTIYLKSRFKPKLYYTDTVSVDLIKELNLRVAYIPDNLPYSNSNEVILSIKDQMKNKNWDTLDYIFFHGYFKHVLPKGMFKEPHCTFNNNQFNFVKSLIVSGHIHTSSRYKKVVYNGSFDRLAHGEEEDKGFLVITDNRKDKPKVEFIKNKEATPFITYDLSKYKEEDAIAEYIFRVKKLNKNVFCHVRVIYPSTSIRQGLISITNKEFNFIRFTHKIPKIKTIEEIRNNFVNISELQKPNLEILPNMIYDFLKEKGHVMDKETILKYVSADV